jgi:hypothetical protein
MMPTVLSSNGVRAGHPPVEERQSPATQGHWHSSQILCFADVRLLLIVVLLAVDSVSALRRIDKAWTASRGHLKAKLSGRH